MTVQRLAQGLFRTSSSKRQQFAYLVYWLVGLGMLALLLLDLESGGEVKLQLPIMFFMGIFFTGPVFVVVFIIPSALSTVYAHQKPRDPLLLLWSWVHIMFWLFLFNNLLYLVDAFVAYMDTIYLAWGTYAVIASCLPLFSFLPGSGKAHTVCVLTLLVAVAVTGYIWDPKQGEFDVPSTPTVESTALLEAAEEGNINEVRSMIDKGADIHAKDDIGWDALHIAVFHGHADIVDYLLQKGANPNTRGYKGPHSRNLAGSEGCALLFGGEPQVLTTALRMGNAPLAQLLVDSGARSNKSLLLTAALGDVEQLRYHLEALQDSIEKPRYKVDINIAFNLAASRPDAEVMDVLLDFGADPDKGLWNAAAFTRRGNVKWLLEHGADPNFSEIIDGPPLMSGFNRRKDQKAYDVRATIQSLIEAGANVNYIKEFGCGNPPDTSILIQNVRKGDFTAVKVLLENAADSNWRDSSGMTAKDYAISMGRQDLVDLLTRHASM